MSKDVVSRSDMAAPFPEGFMASAGGNGPQPQAYPAEMLLTVLLAGLAGVCLSILFGSLPPTRRRSKEASPLLPSQRSWGVTHHERLQDADYLRRILEAEDASSHPDGDDDSSPHGASPSDLQAERPDTEADQEQRTPQ